MTGASATPSATSVADRLCEFIVIRLNYASPNATIFILRLKPKRQAPEIDQSTRRKICPASNCADTPSELTCAVHQAAVLHRHLEATLG
jgi:hypothetical protein